MTESEALGKACPLAKAADKGWDKNCIASRCMAWLETEPGHGFCGMIDTQARIRAMFTSEGGKSESAS